MYQYQTDLNRIHQSEIYGAAIFKTASRFTFRASRKDKWSKLYSLEVQTLDRLFEFLERSNQQTKASKIWIVKGYIDGFFLAIFPWKLSMKLLEKGTKDFQKTFLRLKNNCSDKHKYFYSYVYAHEKAIEKFSQIEQIDGKNSLDKLNQLLVLS